MVQVRDKDAKGIPCDLPSPGIRFLLPISHRSVVVGPPRYRVNRCRCTGPQTRYPSVVNRLLSCSPIRPEPVEACPELGRRGPPPTPSFPRSQHPGKPNPARILTQAPSPTAPHPLLSSLHTPAKDERYGRSRQGHRCPAPGEDDLQVPHPGPPHVPAAPRPCRNAGNRVPRPNATQPVFPTDWAARHITRQCNSIGVQLQPLPTPPRNNSGPPKLDRRSSDRNCFSSFGKVRAGNQLNCRADPLALSLSKGDGGQRAQLPTQSPLPTMARPPHRKYHEAGIPSLPR